MISTTTLVLALASTAFASPLVARTGEEVKPLEVSDMEVSCVKTAPSDPLFSCTLKFQSHFYIYKPILTIALFPDDLNDPNVIDANPSIRPKATCTHHWNWDGKTAENGLENSFETSTLECFSDGVGRNIRSGLYHFSSPTDIQLTLHSSYYKDYDAKLFMNLYYDHVAVAPLKCTKDSEISKIWSYESVQTFENPSVFSYPPTNPDETAA
ncbi:hypothetical protein HOO65_030001 [Ceratocystis lukuohia]|uniref:AA1-like domain-containing protein n=1 Tax=Ceratocystis lukuohia TaxID=2019550 RepID=A0ABR4MJV1_9PEZI